MSSSLNRLNIVLMEPEIPQNTGNIGRTCTGMNASLHLIKPYGFEITDKALKRAGLDYWPNLDLHEYENWSEFIAKVPDTSRLFLLTTKTSKPYYSIDFRLGDYLVFGKETKGLDEALRNQYADQCITIPFPGPIRSFNLSNAVAMVLGEASRQLNLFQGSQPK